MPWANLATAGGTAPASMMTNTNPAIIPTPANDRSWQPAQPTARMQTRAVHVSVATASQVALRGDTRSPATIEAARGLWSHLFNTDPRADVQRHPDARHDPDTHQAGSGAAPYVSTTRDISVAKGFAGTTGYVYLVRVNVGVDYNQYRGGNAYQAEVMAFQGIALRDIVAVRHLSNDLIELNLDFQQANMPPATFNAGILLLSG